MEPSFSFLRLYSLLAIAVFFLGACSAGKLTEDKGVDQYDISYEMMKSVLDQAIRNSGLKVSSLRENSQKTETQVTVRKLVYSGNTGIEQDLGRVVLTELGEGRCQLKITNPQYHFSVPRDQRVNYRRILTKRIDANLYKE